MMTSSHCIALLASAAMLATSACRRPDPAPQVVVSNEESGTISVIDTARDEVTATIQAGKRPRGVRVSPDGNLVYVAVSGSPGRGRDSPRDDAADGIVVIDLGRGVVLRTLPSGRDPE